MMFLWRGGELGEWRHWRKSNLNEGWKSDSECAQKRCNSFE